MPASLLKFSDLRVFIQPESLGFSNTSELLPHSQSLPWIGQERAESAARYGLNMKQPDYHLFVLGEEGSGRTSLLQQLMIEIAANKPVPPDLCVLSNLTVTDKSIILYLPAGQGSKLKHAYLAMIKTVGVKIESYLEDCDSLVKLDLIKTIVDKALDDMKSNLQLPQDAQHQVDAFLAQIQSEIVEYFAIFQNDTKKNKGSDITLNRLLSANRINVPVDNTELTGAPVLIEKNPTNASLFGYLTHSFIEEKTLNDFPRITAGSLLAANGGFVLLNVDDLLDDDALWVKFRQFLRSQKIVIEQQPSSYIANAYVFPRQIFQTNVKIVLIGSAEDYYGLQENDPEFMQHFQVKVDFRKSFPATPQTYRAVAIFVAKFCEKEQLPHFSVAAVACLLEESHRTVEHQKYQNAIFSEVKVLIVESASLCVARHGLLVEVSDIEAALRARDLRNNGPELLLRQAILDGEILIKLSGSHIGRLNALTQIEWGDCQFGTPACITARTFPGEDGLLNIVREVEMSGPIHDKGVLILQSYLSALFSHIAPLALNASIVFEQEYAGIEGDSASCAEFYALLSSLANVPLKQGIAITGAMNQFGEVLPVGAINDKIEGYFKLCAKAGLTGEQGVLIPHANRQHLVLHQDVISAVKSGRFAIYAMEHVMQGLELLSELPSGMDETSHYASGHSSDSVLWHVQKTLSTFRRACQMTQHSHKVEHRRFPLRTEK